MGRGYRLRGATLRWGVKSVSGTLGTSGAPSKTRWPERRQKAGSRCFKCVELGLGCIEQGLGCRPFEGTKILNMPDSSVIERNRVLFVTTDFPPLAGTNTQRVFRLVSALPGLGWDPEVVTLAVEDMAEISAGDLEGLPSSVRVTRIQSPDFFRRRARTQGRRPSDRGVLAKPGIAAHDTAGGGAPQPLRWFRDLATFPAAWGSRGLLWYLKQTSYMPDAQAPWARAAARQIVGRSPSALPDILVTSCPSFSSHVAGLRIRRKLNLPWIADFRDLWTDRPYRRVASPLHRPLERRLERQVFEMADHIVLASPGWIEHYQRKYGSLVAGKLVALPAGFIRRNGFAERVAGVSEKIRFVYTGAMFGAESPAPFLEALGRVLRRRPESRERVDVRFFGYGGTETARLLKLVTEHELGGIVTLNPPVPHAVCLREQDEADVLLLFSGPLHLQTVRGKTFEYLSTGKPILAMIPLEGAQAAILDSAGTGLKVAHGDISAAEAAIEKMLDDMARAGFKPDWSYINSFEQHEIAKRLVDLMEHLLRSRAA